MIFRYHFPVAFSHIWIFFLRVIAYGSGFTRKLLRVWILSFLSFNWIKVKRSELQLKSKMKSLHMSYCNQFLNTYNCIFFVYKLWFSAAVSLKYARPQTNLSFLQPNCSSSRKDTQMKPRTAFSLLMSNNLNVDKNFFSVSPNACKLMCIFDRWNVWRPLWYSFKLTVHLQLSAYSFMSFSDARERFPWSLSPG